MALPFYPIEESFPPPAKHQFFGQLECSWGAQSFQRMKDKQAHRVMFAGDWGRSAFAQWYPCTDIDVDSLET